MQTTHEKRETRGDNLATVFFMVGLMIFVAAFTGCASRTGWEFRIGVAPVTAVDNSSKLQQDNKGE